MKLIIAGSRDYTNSQRVFNLLDKLIVDMPDIEIVSGLCRGPDMFGKDWGDSRGIKVHPFPAEWDKYGPKRAGAIRNKQMGDFADGLIAFWDGRSPGTSNMIDYMKSLGKRHHICYFYKDHG